MKGVIILIVFLFFVISGILSAQEKKFELSYDISGWYEKEKSIEPSKGNTCFLNNNLKIGYRLKSYLSVGISSNFCYRADNSKIPFIYTTEKNYYDIVKSRNYELGTGPYAKVGFGNNFRFSLEVEYNFTNGKDSLFIYNNYSCTYQSAETKYKTQFIASELSIEKKVIDNLFLNVLFRKQYVFIYKYRPIDNYGNFNPYTQSYLGIGITYSF